MIIVQTTLKKGVTSQKRKFRDYQLKVLIKKSKV